MNRSWGGKSLGLAIVLALLVAAYWNGWIPPW